MSTPPEGLRAAPAIIATNADGTVLGRTDDGRLWTGVTKGVGLDQLATVTVDVGGGRWEVWHHYDGWVQGAGSFDHHPDPDETGSQASYVTAVNTDGETLRVPKLKQVIDWKAR